MRATIRTAVLMTAAVIFLGMIAPAASAHSGRSKHGHRSGHEGSGWTQGRSASDPDGMTNGGRDKPGFSGGFSADRDGNNGCGNDDDREDDNNGNCGPRRARVAGAHQEKDDDDRRKVAGAHQKKDDDDDDGKVAGAQEQKPATVTVAGTTVSIVRTPEQLAAAPATETAAAPPAETAVLGAQVEQQPAPAVTPETEVAGAQESRLGALALTGLALGGLALLGAGLVAIGRLARGVGSA